MSVRTEPLIAAAPKTIRRSWLLGGLFLIWFVLAKILQGKETLELPVPENTGFTTWVGDLADSIRGNRSDGATFKYFFNPVREFIDGFVTLIREVIAIPNGNSSIPVLGWLGVLALIGFIVYSISHIRMALTAVSLTFACGALGLWTDSMDTWP